MNLTDSNLFKCIKFRGQTGRVYDELMLISNVPRYELIMNTYVFRIIKSWNRLPFELRVCELSEMGYNTKFKNKVKAYLYKLFTKQYCGVRVSIEDVKITDMKHVTAEVVEMKDHCSRFLCVVRASR